MNQTTMQVTGNKLMMSENHISIRLHPDGFSLWNTDTLNQIKLDKFESGFFSCTESALTHIFSDLPEIATQSKNQQLIFETPYFAFVPDALLPENNLDDILTFQFDDIPDNWITVTQKMELKHVNLVYALPGSLLNVCNHLFPSAIRKHHIHFLLDNMQNESDNSIHLWIRNSSTDFIWMKNNQAVIVNTFHTRTSEDITYYLFKMFEDHENNPENIFIHVYTEEKTIHPEAIRQFFPNLKFHHKSMLS